MPVPGIVPGIVPDMPDPYGTVMLYGPVVF